MAGAFLFYERAKGRRDEGARTLWGDPQLRAEIGERGRRYVSRTRSPDAVGEGWAETLRQTLTE